jgi:glyoxylase-like metal-dependent hydrolase (beta-lactamase superfamily II)
VYATLADPTKGQEGLSNGGIIAGRDAVLIVEGHFQPACAALEIEAAHTISKAAVRAAIDTHYHLDHSFGNAAYADQSIPILAHERTAQLMKERYAALQGADRSSLMAPLQRRLASAIDPADKKRREADLEFYRWMYDAIDAAKVVPPSELLRTEDFPKRIDLGGLTAMLEFLPGHSPTDLIVRVPERDVVFTGDLLFNRAYPVNIDADMVAWRKVLDLFAGYNRRTQFVPGHAAICGLETVREQQALFDHLHAHAERIRKAGGTAEEAERSYTIPRQFQDYHMRSWGISVGAAMQSYFRAMIG